MDHNVFDYQVQRLTPKQLREAPNALSDWVRGHGFKQVAVHFDLDALLPTAFRSIYPAEPGTDPADFPATVGQLTLPEVANLLTQLDQKRRTGRLDGGRAHGLGRAQFTPVFKWVVLVGVKQQRPYH